MIKGLSHSVVFEETFNRACAIAVESLHTGIYAKDLPKQGPGERTATTQQRRPWDDHTKPLYMRRHQAPQRWGPQARDNCQLWHPISVQGR